MAETKASAPPKAKSTSASATAEHVVEGEESYEKGYWGVRTNPHPDEAFALTTGPDAPVTDQLGNPVETETD